MTTNRGAIPFNVDDAQGLFSVYRAAALSALQAAANVGVFEVAFDTEEFDVSAWHDTSTGRFTPQVPGYYRLNARASASASTDIDFAVNLLKNGTIYKRGPTAHPLDPANPKGSMVTALVLLNGTTDYVSVGVYHNGTGSLALDVGASFLYFQGELRARS